jgi:hypothetical protein
MVHLTESGTFRGRSRCERREIGAWTGTWCVVLGCIPTRHTRQGLPEPLAEPERPPAFCPALLYDAGPYLHRLQPEVAATDLEPGEPNVASGGQKARPLLVAACTSPESPAEEAPRGRELPGEPCALVLRSRPGAGEESQGAGWVACRRSRTQEVTSVSAVSSPLTPLAVPLRVAPVSANRPSSGCGPSTQRRRWSVSVRTGRGRRRPGPWRWHRRGH